MSLHHWMSFSTFKEQNYFRFPNPDIYAGVVFNANMVAHAPSGLSAFLLEKTRAEFPYIIDPITHAFQHDIKFIQNDSGEIKSSLSNLAKAYGSVIEINAGIRPVEPNDFNNVETNIEFVVNCFEFQRTILLNAIRESDTLKYLGDIENAYSPYALVAPYFYMDEVNFNEWITRNAEFAQIAIDQRQEGERVFIPIVIGSEILIDGDLIDQLVHTYQGVQNEGFLLWVSDYDECLAKSSSLKGLLRLTRELRENSSKEMLNLHGGYFSVLSSSPLFGEPTFSGVAHGPEFGEYRDVVPVGGGIPISKFYTHQLHSRIRYKEALQLFTSLGWLSSTDQYYAEICDCPECRSVIEDSADNFTKFGETDDKQVKRRFGFVTLQYPTRETKTRCLRHYLYRKAMEYDFVNNLDSKDQGLRNLSQAYDEISRISPSMVKHLKRWELALN